VSWELLVQYPDRKVPQEDRNRMRETGGWHREVCFWLVLGRGFFPTGVSSRALEAHSRTLGKLLLVWHSVVPTVVQEQCLFVQLPGMLQAGVDGSCLHAPKNWLVRQQIDLRDNKVSTQSRIY
jgi:hypothetical protein